jgi:NADH:ubiquinone oxidoreductase subunit K
MIPIEHFIFLSAALFVIGLMIVIIKKNAIVVLIGIELMLNSANLNLVAFSQIDKDHFQGQIFTLFVIVIAAAEAAVALAIVLNIFRQFGVSDVDKVNQLKG